LSRAQRPVTLQPASCRGKHPQEIPVFFAFDISYKPLHPNLEIIDAQEIKAPFMVSGRCPHPEDRRQEEDPGGKHCPNLETD
jgi:hypothetical protein